MTALWNHMLTLSHLLFDWLLVFPRDLRITLLALLTGGLLLLARKFLTDQGYLKQVTADLKTLKRLTAEARKRRDRDTKARHTQNTLALRQRMLNAQLPAILAALIPLALAGIWAQDALLMSWPGPDRVATIKLMAPAGESGRLAHIIPDDGISCERPITRLDADTTAKGAASATWDLSLPESDEGKVLVVIRCGPRTIEHVLAQRKGALYGPPRQIHGDGWVSDIFMPETRLFSVVPGWPAIGIPAWAAGYLLMVLLAYPGLKRLLRVY